jgi:hypothetical protein
VDHGAANEFLEQTNLAVVRLGCASGVGHGQSEAVALIVAGKRFAGMICAGDNLAARRHIERGSLLKKSVLYFLFIYFQAAIPVLRNPLSCRLRKVRSQTR